MKFFSNLPDQEHIPYKFITDEPHIKTIVRYFRPSDYLAIGAVGFGFPGALYLWG